MPRFVVIVLAAGPTTSTLAGISGVRFPLYILLAVISLFFRLTIMYEFADVFREPIEQLLVWIERYQLPGTIIIVTGIIAWQLFKRRRAARAAANPSQQRAEG